jgi:hypothetical protein
MTSIITGGFSFGMKVFSHGKGNPKVMKMDDEAITKELRLEVMTKTKYDDDRKGTKTI